MDLEQTIISIKQSLENATAQINQAKYLLANISQNSNKESLNNEVTFDVTANIEGNTQVVEGVFNGQNMVGADGKVYAIPANYASKSKLVEGDLLKLTIRADGSFIYKQIGPVERKRLVGVLVQDNTTGEYTVLVEKQSYKVILAAITYYKGAVGDEVVILTPPDGNSAWAAVENVISKHLLDSGSAAELTSSTEKALSDGSAAELPSGEQAELI